MEAQLHEYNAAFRAFFHRLADDGITKRNTVFLVTVDEGDHYAGGGPLNPGCDGVHVACQYDTAETGAAAFGTAGFTRNVGEVDANLPALIKGTTGDATTFGFDNDDAPAIIVPNQSSPSGPRPGPDDGTVRGQEREIAGTSEFDPITGQTTPITVNLADETEENILHMTNPDPNRTPTFTLFGNDDFFFQSVCSNVGVTTSHPPTPAPVTDQGPGCPAQGAGFAWNHGDIQPQIATTWQGWVGPGVANLGQTSRIWTDHTDARPTLMTLLGLHDDYTWDGRAIEQILGHGEAGHDGRANHGAGPGGRAEVNSALLDALGAAYKQLDAPFGSFGLDTLNADTAALAGNSASDADYVATDGQLQACDSARGALVPRIQAALLQAETGQRALSPFEAISLIARADRLIADAHRLESSATPPTRTLCS